MPLSQSASEQIIREMREIIDEANKPFDHARMQKLMSELESNIQQYSPERDGKAAKKVLSSSRHRRHADKREISDISDHDAEWRPGQQLTISNNEELIREIQDLNRLIDMYHNEAQRRKRGYLRIIEDLNKEVDELKAICGSFAV